MYIVFEGIVGTGKSTQANKLFSYLQKKFPKKKVILTREPGGSEIAEMIRRVVQGMEFKEEMEPICEAYLYAAARAQSLRSVVKPVLEKKGIVISDRSFLTSLYYQGVARGLGVDFVYDINSKAIDGIIPDIVFYMNMPIEKGMQRTFDKGGDKFEKFPVEFFKKANRGLAKMKKLPVLKNKIVEINADQDVEKVFADILEKLENKFKN